MPPRSNILAAASALAVIVLMAWAQDDDSRRLADQQDAEAISSREWAGQQICGPDATPEWLDAKTLQCLKHAEPPVRIAGAAP